MIAASCKPDALYRVAVHGEDGRQTQAAGCDESDLNSPMRRHVYLFLQNLHGEGAAQRQYGGACEPRSLREPVLRAAPDHWSDPRAG